MTSHKPTSVSDTLGTYAWNSEKVAAYEAALEAANAAIGAYSREIALEEAKRSPDQELIGELRSFQARLVERQRKLDPKDHAQLVQARELFTRSARGAGRQASLLQRARRTSVERARRV